MPKEGNSRTASIDHAKAIGISLVCIGHFLSAGSNSRIFLYSFHVPLFFILAGIVSGMKGSSDQPLCQKIRKLCRRILLPYSVWFWISAVPAYFLWGNSLEELWETFFFLNGKTLWNTALWFLPCYFITMSIFELVCHFSRHNKKWLVFSALLSFSMAVIFDVKQVTECFLGINKCCLMYVMVVVGYLARRMIVPCKSGCLYIPIGAVFAFTGLISCIYHAGNNISIMNVDYNNIFVFTVISIVMSLSFISLCSCLPYCTVMARIAQNSLFIMSTHLAFRQLCDIFILFAPVYFQNIYKYIGFMLIPIYIVALTVYDKIAAKNRVLRIMGGWVGLKAPSVAP